MERIATPYLLGIDVGSTHCKAVVFDREGREVSKAIAETATHYAGDGSGAAYYLAGEIWDAVREVIRKALNPPAGRRLAVDALAVTSVGEAGVMLGADKEPVYPVIAWFDTRATINSKKLEKALGAERIHRITGLPPSGIFSLPKLAWVKENEPEVFRRTERWLPICDYVAYKLCGAEFTDVSQASRMMAFDLGEGEWSLELLEAAGVRPSVFPPVVKSDSVVGKVAAEAARLTGLTEGTPVIAGGHDHICAAFGVGVIQPGLVMDSAGTAESVVFVTRRPFLEREGLEKGLRAGRHVAHPAFYVAVGLPAGGATIDWAMEQFGPFSSYEEMLRQAGEVSPGSEGILFLPYLRGAGPPTWDPGARAGMLGLRLQHKKAELVRAVMEGLAFEVSRILHIGSELDLAPHTVRATGGGAKNALWLQLKADITGLPFEAPESTESAALGAALLAGLGVGLYADADAAVRETYRAVRVFRPDGARREEYAALAEIYDEADAAIRPLSRRLDAWARRADVEEAVR